VWPTIQTTVAELNNANINQIINSMGGKLLFSFAILGIILNFYDFKEKRFKWNFSSFVLAFWLIASIYTTFRGIRFTLLMVPPFAIALGIFFGKAYRIILATIQDLMESDEGWLRVVSSIVIIFILSLFLITPIKSGYSTALHEVPSMNDAWWNALTKIKLESKPDSIINSWWDFGHWFITIANRSVTFDGAGQDRHMAYWIGRSLLISPEKYTIGILNMVDCGNNNAFYVLNSYINNEVKSIDILNKIVLEDKEEARKTLRSLGLSKEQTEKVLKYSKCKAPDDYYITSDDMVGKSGVWAHFGSWDFHKAEMYYLTNSKDESAGVKILKDNFSLDDDEAYKTYYEIKNKDPDHWIAPWPSYMGEVGCNIKDSKITCGGINIDLKEKTAKVSTREGIINAHSVVYPTSDDVKEIIIDNRSSISIALIPSNGAVKALLMDKALAMSAFTRLYYFKGHGLKCFELFDYQRSFSGNQIYTWKVDWNCSSKRIVKELASPQEIRVRHILVNSSEEAEKILNMVKSGEDFAKLAEKHSIGPSGKRGGDLGYFKKGMMVPEFDAAAFNLTKLGQISNIVQTKFGYHIIQLIGIKKFGITKEWNGLNTLKEMKANSEQVKEKTNTTNINNIKIHNKTTNNSINKTATNESK